MDFNIFFPISVEQKMSGLPTGIAFLGIIPALIVIYISLKGYEEYFEERKIFIMFMVGIIAGFIAAIIETLTLGIGILFVILFPFLEQLLKTMILNLRRFYMKPDTIIYGLCLGLGFGSIFTAFSIIYQQFIRADNVTTGIDLYSISLVLIGSFGIILLHGATGMLIGYGISKGKLLRCFSYTIILQIPFTGLDVVTNYLNAEYLQVLTVGYGVVIYWLAIKRILPKVLPQNQRRKRTKKTTKEKT